MYDKAAQQKIDGEITRIEARINRRDIRFRDLVEIGIPNPFHNFFVISTDDLQLIANKWKHPRLVHNVRTLGVYGATLGNQPARKRLLKHLEEHTVKWWQPDIFWDAHKKMLLEFKSPLLKYSA